MQPLRTRLEAVRREKGTPWEVLERDYLLSWIIAGIASHQSLSKTLIFKGGTALKKCYFGDYRFSEDIDFSAIDNELKGNVLEAAIREACLHAEVWMNEHSPIKVGVERYLEKEPHPDGQEAFVVRAKFPWHREPTVRILIEVTHEEQVLMPASMRNIIHEYGEKIPEVVSTYTLEEIIAEKLRAILQHTKKIHEKGWSRSRARDYYDIWRILGAYAGSLDLNYIPVLLEKKCTNKGVKFLNVECFFQKLMIINVEKTWNQWLGPLVRNLPACNTVVIELKSEIENLLTKGKIS